MGGLKVVTVMFHDRNGVLAVSESFRARECTAQSLSATLTGGSVVSAISSLSRTLNAWALREFSRHRTRSRTSPSINKFSAEKPIAFSALAVSAVNPNRRGKQAAKDETTTMTEQRRCRVA